ncbi:Neurofilament medium polypeptide like [Actinidia chinensis var. chinensis]|uniref:Neurofilament medium polypeptide like n=1 Tax=Actinidia chinensis var. chinensis TaxID=1590841 RepID=A0A2R6PK93_ACTCC|nr:Neurofilament medium polypeptide like [Actinidia chinensis var. chinensis]
MGNEMGNSNVSGLEEEEIPTVEATKNSGPEANHVQGENQIVLEGEDKDFHEKIDDQTSDGNEMLPIESDDEGGDQESGTQAASSPEDLEHSLDKETESGLEANLLGTSDHQIRKQTSIRREPLEFVAPESNNFDEHEHSEVHVELIEEEGNKGSAESSSCQAEAKGNLLEETETAQNLAEIVVSEAANLTEETIQDESLVKEIVAAMSINDDRRESMSEEVPSEMNLTRNDSSKSADKAVSKTNSSNSFEKVPSEMSLSRNGSSKSAEEAISLINSSNYFEQVPNEMSLSRNGSSKSDQEAISMVNSLNTFEQVPTEIYFRNGSSNSSQEAVSLVNSSSSLEEGPQTEDKCMVLVEDMNVVSNIPENETKHHPEPVHEPAMNESKNDEINASQPESMLVDSSSIGGNETYQFETDPTEFTVTEQSEETVQTEKEEDIKAMEEKEENLKTLGSGTEERETLAQPISQSSCVEYINSLLTGLNQENVVSNALGFSPSVRKSPSFDFDLSLEARSEESDQTPLLHQNKTKTRSLSTLDGSVQYRAILLEEKTIEVERSNLDKQRAPFLNFLIEEEKKKDGGVDEKREVAIMKRREKRKPRPSLFSTCICCAAAIN